MVTANLGQSEAVAVAVSHFAQPFEELRNIRMRLVVEMLLKIKGAGAFPTIGCWRIIAQFGIVHREVDRVDPKAVDAALEPEARDP